MHRGAWSNTKIWTICQDYAKFGVPLHFTETTLLSGANGWNLTANGKSWPSTVEGEKRQADEVERVYTMLFSHPAVAAITWWDFSDRSAWQQAPAGLLRADMSAKPAYLRLHDLITNRWWSRTRIRTDANGKALFRGFLGEYQVTVRIPPNGEAVAHMILKKRSANTLTVKLP
jgi:endo-1,4-beta-xylanase